MDNKDSKQQPSDSTESTGTGLSLSVASGLDNEIKDESASSAPTTSFPKTNSASAVPISTSVSSVTTSTSTSKPKPSVLPTTTGSGSLVSTATATTTSTSASIRHQRTPSPPKKTSSLVQPQVESMDTTPVTNTTPSPLAQPSGLSSAQKSDTSSNPLPVPSSTIEPERESTSKVDSDKTEAKNPVQLITSSSSIKRPAADSPPASDVPLEVSEVGDNGESTAAGSDAKRRKIRRDFKFDTRDPQSSTENSGSRITFSTGGRPSSGFKPGKPTSAQSANKSSTSTTSEKNTAIVSLGATATTTTSQNPVPIDTIVESSLKGNEPSETLPTTTSGEVAVAKQIVVDKEKETCGGNNGGLKVPPIKIVLGSNGTSGTADNTDHSSTSHHSHGNSPTSSFPYVVSSTTPDSSSNNNSGAQLSTTSQTSSTTTTTTTTTASNVLTARTDTKKEPGTRIKLVATIGPTNTLTYTSSSSTTGSTTTILTTTSTPVTGSSNTKQETVEVSKPVPTEKQVTNEKTTASTTTSATLTTAVPPPSSVTSTISSTVPTPSSPAASPVNAASAVESSSNDAGKAKQNVHESTSSMSQPVAPTNDSNACTEPKDGPLLSPSSSSPVISKEKDDTKDKSKSNSNGSSPATVSSTTTTIPMTTATTVPLSTSNSSSTTITTSTSAITGTLSDGLAKEKPHRVTRSSHRIAATTGTTSGISTASTAGNGQAPSSPAPATGNSPKTSACSSPGQPDPPVPMDTSVPSSTATTSSAKVPETTEKTDSADSANADLQQRKRKLKSKDATGTGTGATSSSNSSTSGDANETVNASNNPTDQQPVLNCFEMYLNIRKQIEQRRRNLFPVQPKPPQGFKDYLMNRATYVLAGNTNARMSVPLSPANLPIQMKETFIEQEKERHKLRLQHLVEKEKLVLSVEQEILRVHGRAARALSNQALPFSVCTILKDQEVYNLLTPEQEEKDRNARSRYNGRLFLSWLQDVDDKWDKIKESMLLRHHNEAESLAAVQKMNWEWKLKEFGICEPKKPAPAIDDIHVPMVHVNDDFDLLPA